MNQQYPMPGYDATRSNYLPTAISLSQPIETQCSVSVDGKTQPIVANNIVLCGTPQGIVGYDVDTGQPQLKIADWGCRSSAVEQTTMYVISDGDVGAISLQTGTELWKASGEFMSLGNKHLIVTDTALYAVEQRRDQISEEYMPMAVTYGEKSGTGVQRELPLPTRSR